MKTQLADNMKNNISFKIRLADMNFKRSIYLSLALFCISLYFYIEGAIVADAVYPQLHLKRLDGIFCGTNLVFIILWMVSNLSKKNLHLDNYKYKNISVLILLSLFVFWASIALSLHIAMDNTYAGYYFFIICIFIVGGLFYLSRKMRIFIWCLSIISFFFFYVVFNPGTILFTSKTIILFPPLVISYLLAEVSFWYMYVFYKQYQENTLLNIMLAKKNIQLDDKVMIKTEELLIAKEKAENSNQQKTDFIVNMSHDIRNPLSVILGYAELLSEENLSEIEKNEAVNIIKDSSHQLNVLISDIIDLSKIDSGKMHIQKSNINVNKVMDNLFASFRLQIENKNKTKIHLVVSKDQPKENVLLYTDEIRIKQILTNLLDNAVKFTEKGIIELGYKIQVDNILFFIKDSGIGIGKEDQNLIFQQYKQIKNIDGGKGLGLAICYNLIKLLDGKVWVESKENIGTEFYFTLPYYIENIAETKLNNHLKSKEKFNFDGKIIALLIKEKNKDSHLDLLLKKHNSYNILYNSTNELVDIISQEGMPIDLLLVDFNINNEVDKQDLQRIKEANPNLPIIGQSANAFKNEKPIYLSLGFKDFFFKPFDTYNLLSSINKVFNITDND